MAIAIFGFIWTERIACLTLVMVGLGGFLVALTGHTNELVALVHIRPLPAWLPLNLSSFWLGVQSLLIMGGGIGAWRCTSFTLALAGVLAALLFVTPIGIASFLPGVWMSFLLGQRWRAFFPKRYGWFPDRNL
jgi:hypothetical protein